MFRLIKLIIWIGAISWGIIFWQYGWYTDQTLSISGSVYEVQAGDTFAKILQRETGSSIYTRLYLRQNPPDFPLQKWKYALSWQYSVETFLEALKQPINEDKQITILEGWNIYDIDKQLTNTWLTSSWEFVSYVTTWDFDQYHFLTELDSLEWYLYPDTYNINPNGFAISELVTQMLNNFNKKVYQPYFSHADNETIFELITMASIVQKEASFGDDSTEIATIAGILKKRLDEWWQIGADATVCYAHKVATQDCSPTEVVKYLYDVNPYNTRVISGAPAWPIANPEVQVIAATLNSIDSPYYYYLHDNSWQIHYGRTDAEHINNKNTYLR